MTIDEELSLLDSQLRRLKIEYEIYFSNPTKRPPTDIEWKVLSLLRKFSDGGRMSFPNASATTKSRSAMRSIATCGARKTASVKKATAAPRMRCSRCRECARRNMNRNTKSTASDSRQLERPGGGGSRNG